MNNQELSVYMGLRWQDIERQSLDFRYQLDGPATDGPDADLKQLFRLYAEAVYNKARCARDKYGFHPLGWATPDWEAECQAGLAEHVAKGDPRDNTVFNAFMWFHGWRTSPAPSSSLLEGGPADEVLNKYEQFINEAVISLKEYCRLPQHGAAVEALLTAYKALAAAPALLSSGGPAAEDLERSDKIIARNLCYALRDIGLPSDGLTDSKARKLILNALKLQALPFAFAEANATPAPVSTSLGGGADDENPLAVVHEVLIQWLDENETIDFDHNDVAHLFGMLGTAGYSILPNARINQVNKLLDQSIESVSEGTAALDEAYQHVEKGEAKLLNLQEQLHKVERHMEEFGALADYWHDKFAKGEPEPSLDDLIKQEYLRPAKPFTPADPLLVDSSGADKWISTTEGVLPTQFDEDGFSAKMLICIDGEPSTEAAYYMKRGYWSVAGRYGTVPNVTHYQPWPSGPARKEADHD